MNYKQFPPWLKVITVILSIVAILSILASAYILFVYLSGVASGPLGIFIIIVIFYPTILACYGLWSLAYAITYKKWRFLIISLIITGLLLSPIIFFA